MRYLYILFLLFIALWAQCQEISIRPINWSALTGLQSFTWGSIEDGYIIFGGRVDGLHRRQPFASFDIAGHNTQIQWIHPASQQILTINTTDFPLSVQEQMHSTNACFTQVGNKLMVVGGYGFSEIQQEHKTFNQILIFDLGVLKNCIINGFSAASSLIFQAVDDQFAVTGGKLLLMNEVYYLTVGHRFDGKYNPIGPDHGPGFTQQYTESIRRFTIDESFNITWLENWSDSSLLHRRDLNVVPMLSGNGEEACTIYSGVFQPALDIPYLNAIKVTANGFNEISSFAQYYNHYHCATMALYDSIQFSNTHYFFGGISQYYDSLGQLVQNNNVPFVKSIAKVVHSSDGSVSEFLLPIHMPGYLGAGSEFLPVYNIPIYQNGVIKKNLLVGDSVLIGYIYGGINSSAKNIFWNNEGDLSSAANLWMEIYYHNDGSSAIQNIQSHNGVMLQVYPNPFSNDIHVQFTMEKSESQEVEIVWYKASGEQIQSSTHSNLKSGRNEVIFKNKENWVSGTYIVEMKIDQSIIRQRVVFEP